MEDFLVDLTLNLRGPSYRGFTRLISWLLMPWLLVSPGHQQPWYWLSKMGKSWYYTRTDFNYLWYISVEEWHKTYMFMFPQQNSARKKLSDLITHFNQGCITWSAAMLRFPNANEVTEYLEDIGKIDLYQTGNNTHKKARNLCIIIMVYHKFGKTSKRSEIKRPICSRNILIIVKSLI